MGHFGRRRLYQKIARQDCKPLPKGRAARRLLTAPPFHPPRREKAAPARSLARLKADFIVETAIECGVKIAIVGDPLDPTVFAYAPTAPDWDRQLACEASFRDAVEDNLDEVIVLGEREI